MPIDPKQRDGKGRFADPPADIEADQELINDVIKKAQTRTVLLDYLQMFFVSFFSTIKGLIGLDRSERND